MKKVLLIADRDLGTSGVPAVIMSIVRGLHSRFIFDVVTFEQNNSAFENEFNSYGGRIIKFDIKKPSPLFKRILFYLFNYRKQIIKECDKKINIKDYDVVHSFKGIFSAPFLEYAKRNGVGKRILHINGVYDKNPKFYLEYLNKRNRRKCLKYSNIRLAVSDEAGYSFFGRKDFKVVLNPINDKVYKKLSPYYDVLSLTQIGTFSSRKNQLFSLEVFKEVKQRYPNAIMNFLGYEVDAEYLDKLKSEIKCSNLDGSIFFYNKSFDQIELLSKTSICLFPSKSEAFGLVAVENQACNRPVICSKKIIKEVDCGGAIFLDFDPIIWAKTICDIFASKRQFDIDASKFENDKYCLTICSIYSNN